MSGRMVLLVCLWVFLFAFRFPVNVVRSYVRGHMVVLFLDLWAPVCPSPFIRIRVCVFGGRVCVLPSSVLVTRRFSCVCLCVCSCQCISQLRAVCACAGVVRWLWSVIE